MTPELDPSTERPQSKTELFLTFNALALQGFGGVLAVAQRELVENKRWMTKTEFVEMLALGQVLPGPNVVNIALMFGDRFFGLRGALAALAGMLAVPLVIVLCLTAAYAEFSRVAIVSGALRGMGAVAAGLILSTAFKLIGTLRTNRLGLPTAALFAVLTVVMVAWLRWPLIWVVVGLGSVGIALAWRRLVTGLLHTQLGAADLLGLFGHFLMLSLLAVGGAITTAPGMHRYVVDQHHWLVDAQFSASIAIAQAAPGPNVLFVAAIGWNVAGPLGATATMVGTLLPSTLLTLFVNRWGLRRRETRGLRAFTTGMTPLTIGLLVSTGWVLAVPYVVDGPERLGAIALVGFVFVVMTRTRIGPIWLVAVGAVVGAMGWV